jgi:hypothetical protein
LRNLREAVAFVLAVFPLFSILFPIYRFAVLLYFNMIFDIKVPASLKKVSKNLFSILLSLRVKPAGGGK